MPLSFTVIMDPLAEPTAVFSWSDRREGSAWESDAFPQIFYFFLPVIDSKNVYNPHKVPLVWPIDDMNGVFAVW